MDDTNPWLGHASFCPCSQTASGFCEVSCNSNTKKGEKTTCPVIFFPSPPPPPPFFSFSFSFLDITLTSWLVHCDELSLVRPYIIWMFSTPYECSQHHASFHVHDCFTWHVAIKIYWYNMERWSFELQLYWLVWINIDFLSTAQGQLTTIKCWVSSYGHQLLVLLVRLRRCMHTDRSRIGKA